VRAEMFGQLTTGLESAWNKLRGVGACLCFFFVPTINASFLLFFHALLKT
jgi:signal recognition particle subunit SRP54